MTAPTEVPIGPPEDDPADQRSAALGDVAETAGVVAMAEAENADVAAMAVAEEAVAEEAEAEMGEPEAIAEPAVAEPAVAEPAAAEQATATSTPPRNSLENLKFAVMGIIVLAAAVLAFAQLNGTNSTRGSADADAAALAVIASDIVTSAKNDGGAVDAIGGYLPGTGIVLTVELDGTDSATTADWVSEHLGPFAETLAIMPVDESIVVTINDRQQDTARVWSLPVSSLGSNVRDWNQLVAPATFESNELIVAAAPEPATDASDQDEPVDEDEAFGEDEPVDEAPVDEAPVDEAPVDEAPIEEAPVEEAPVDVPETNLATTNDGGIGLGGDRELRVINAFEDGDSFEPIFGSWALEDGVYSQNDATGFGYSAAYAGFVPDVYDVSVDMRAPSGDLNAGIIYGMPAPNRKHGGSVIDLTAESTYLRWGEYDEVSGDWTFLGGAPVEPGLVQDEWQNLKLEVRPEGTSVLLNEQFVVTLDPVAAGGHVALVVSIANVEFKDFFVTGPGGTPIDPSIADGTGTDRSASDYVVFDNDLREWTLLSGSWTADGDVLSQGNGQAYDQMVHFSNFEQNDYRVEVELRAKPGSIFSGGLLFNVSTFGQRPDSQLFDIVDDGQVIRWAGYDQNGVFSYVGGLRTRAGFEPDAWHTMAVEVRNGQAAFFVDGDQVGASDSVGDAGYVGLVTSLAEMEFRNFAVTPLS